MAYRLAFDRGLAGDMCDDKKEAVARLRDINWSRIKPTNQDAAALTLARYFRLFHGGNYTIEMWNQAVHRYAEPLSPDSMNPCKYLTLRTKLELERSHRQWESDYEDSQARISGKRWVSWKAPPYYVSGRVYTYGQIRARMARFEKLQKAKATAKAAQRAKEIQQIGKQIISQAAALTPSPAQLYRHWDKGGRLLYVGISCNFVNRLAQHRNDSAWFPLIANVTIEHFDTREECEAAERHAIRTELPIFNRAHSVLRLVA